MTTVFEASPRKQASPARPNIWPDRLLGFSGVLWFFAAAIGQWIFVYYVAAYYIPFLARSGLPGLADTTLPHGHVPGDLIGNLAIAIHVQPDRTPFDAGRT